MSDYSEFFLNSDSNVVELETLEISHSLFSQVYYVVRNGVGGITATLETSESAFFEYYPLRIQHPSEVGDLEQSIQVTLGDLGDLIPAEIDAVRAADGWDEFPVVKFRVYRSDDLSAPLYGPLTLEVQKLTNTWEGAVFEAKPPTANANKTGERYVIPRFPMLRGVIK